MSILNTLTDARKLKVIEAVSVLGLPGSGTVFNSDHRAKICSFFCGLGLPYMPKAIEILQAAYHSIADNGFGLMPLLNELSGDEKVRLDAMYEIIARYKSIISAPQTQPIQEAIVSKPEVKAKTDDKTMAMAQAIAALLSSPKAEIDEDKVIALIKKHSLATELRIVSDKGTSVIPTGLHHTILPDVLLTLKAGLNVYLVGPAGSGKTTLAIQLAKALGVSFHFNGALDSEYKLTGFMDAQGRYVKTAFREAYENGGLYLFDELDASAASALLAFNAALENGHSDFPDGCIKMHKDFYCIAAANTYGTGADRVYIGRNQLDGAFLDRFAFIEMNYDEKLERALSGNDVWVDYVQSIRRAIKSHKIRHIVSPRASIKGAQLLAAGQDRHKVEANLIWKGLDNDSISKIKQAA